MQSNEKSFSRTVAIPLILFLAALALRLYAALVPGIIVPDGVVYIETARMIEAGQWQRVSDVGIYSLYPFMIVAFHKVLADWELAGRLISVIFGSLAVLPLYFLFKRMFDIRIAGVAGFFFVISPKLVEFSSNVIREPAFWFFSICALWVVWEAIEQQRWYYMPIASLFVGMSIITRMEGIALIPITFFWMGWRLLKSKKLRSRTVLVYVVIFLVSFPIIFITPLYCVKNKLGKWEIGQLGTKVPRFLFSGNQGAENVFRQSLSDADTVTKIVSGNKYIFYLWETIYKSYRSCHVLFVFLFLIGIVRRRIVPRDAVKEMPVITWCCVFFLLSLLYASRTFYLSTRHGMLISIPALLWVSIGFYELSDMIRKFLAKHGWDRLYARKPTAALLALISIIVMPSTLAWSGHEKEEMKKAGIYLKTTGYAKERIALEPRLVRLGFYAEADYILIPPLGSDEEIRTFLDNNRIGYMVVDEMSIESMIKDYKDNLDRLNLEKVNIPEFNTYKEYSFKVLKVK